MCQAQISGVFGCSVWRCRRTDMPPYCKNWTARFLGNAYAQRMDFEILHKTNNLHPHTIHTKHNDYRGKQCSMVLFLFYGNDCWGIIFPVHFFYSCLEEMADSIFFLCFCATFFFSSLSWHWQCFFSLVSGNASSSSSSPLATFLSSPLWCKLCLFLVLMKWLFFLNNKRCFFDLYSVHRRHFKWNRIHFVLNRVVKCSKPSFLSICFLLSKIFTTAMCQRHTRMPLYTRLIIGLI